VTAPAESRHANGRAVRCRKARQGSVRSERSPTTELDDEQELAEIAARSRIRPAALRRDAPVPAVVLVVGGSSSSAPTRSCSRICSRGSILPAPASIPTSRRGREVVGVEMVLLDALASGGLLESFSDSRKVFLDGQPIAYEVV
jgi:hypothetical protein